MVSGRSGSLTLMFLVLFLLSFSISGNEAQAYNLNCTLKDPLGSIVEESQSIDWTDWMHAGGTCGSCRHCDYNNLELPLDTPCSIDCYSGPNVKPSCCQAEGQYALEIVSDDVGLPRCISSDAQIGNEIVCNGADYEFNVSFYYHYRYVDFGFGSLNPRCACDLVVGYTFPDDCPYTDWYLHEGVEETSPPTHTCYDWTIPFLVTRSMRYVGTLKAIKGCGKYAHTVAWDKEERYCSCKAGPDAWGIGCSSGDCASGGNCPFASSCVGEAYIDCCGDDANEYSIDCEDDCPDSDPGCTGVFCIAGDLACCGTSSDCVYANACYWDGTVPFVGSEWRCQNTIWVDEVGPSATIDVIGSNPVGSFYDSGAQKYVGVAGAQILTIATDFGSGLKECRYYEATAVPGAWSAAACNTIGTVALPAGDGVKNINLQARDRSGNVNTVSGNVYLDQTPPGAPVRNPASRDWAGTPVDVTVTYSDAGSGVDVAYYCWTEGVSCDPNIIFMNGGIVTQIAEGAWTLCTKATDNVGNEGGPHCSPQGAYRVDMSNPIVAIVSPPPGSWQSSDFPVTVSDTDMGGSGIDSTSCEYRVFDIGLGVYTRGWTSRTCSGDVTVTVGAGQDCESSGLDMCRVEARNSDNVGNPSGVDTRTFSVDLDGPCACSIDYLSEGTSPDYQHIVGNTVYYNNDAAGSFDVGVYADDCGGGIDRVSFPDVYGSDGGDDTTSPYDWGYSWLLTSTYSAGVTINCYDLSGAANSTWFDLLLDIEPPAGGSVGYPDGPYNETTVTVSFDPGTDALSGIDPTSAEVHRMEATLSSESCAGWGGWSVIETFPASAPPNTDLTDTVSNGKCYAYKYVVADMVSNVAEFTSANVLMVDTTPPPGPATFDDTNVPNGDYDSDGVLDFTFTVPADDTGISDCFMSITVGPAGPVAWEGWMGPSGGCSIVGPNGLCTFTGTDGNAYYARTRCLDNAGNLGPFGAQSDGIIVDTADPVIPVVSDIRDGLSIVDRDFIQRSDVVGVYFEATDSATPLVLMEYTLVEDGAVPRTVKPWSSDWTAQGGGYVAVLNFSEGTLPELLVEGSSYHFSVRVTDSVGRTATNSSDGFTIRACDGQPCGSECSVGGVDGVCDGSDNCYLGGGCDLDCVPPAGGTRACYDNTNVPIDCAAFRPLCGRAGATKCGDGSLCEDSINAMQCLGSAGSGINCIAMSGGWTAYTPPFEGVYYGPNKPFTVSVTGISVLPANYVPLLHFEMVTPVGPHYLDRWGTNDASLQFSGFPLGSDGIWNITKAALMTDFAENSGWDIPGAVDLTTISLMVDTTDPVAALAVPVAGDYVGIQFDVAWDGSDPVVNGISSGVDCYDLRYVDKAVYLAGGGWNTFPCDFRLSRTFNMEGNLSGTELCFGLRGKDNADNTGAWSCEPGPPGPTADFSGCDCATLDLDPPDESGTWIESNPIYTNSSPSSFLVEWSSTDTGAGILGYIVEYTAVNNRTGAVIQPWTAWTAINDLSGVQVYDGSYSNMDATSLTSATFVPNDVMGSDGEGRTYYFRVRAIDDTVGYSNIGAFVTSLNGSWVDRTPPATIASAALEPSGTPIPDGSRVFTGNRVRISVQGDPMGVDYSGVNESWIVYTLTSAAGRVTTMVSGCGGEESGCGIVLGPWYDDYTVSYQGFSRDRAGNVGASLVHSFRVERPIAIISSTRDLFLTLGSYANIHVDLSNRQDVSEFITVTMDDLKIPKNYQHAYFSSVSDGDLSADKRTVNVSLNPLETKSLTVKVYTARVEKTNLTVWANSTINSDIEDRMMVTVNILYPVEFPGLAWPALVVLFAAAASAYALSGRREPDGK